MKSPVQHGPTNRDARFGHMQIPATNEIPNYSAMSTKTNSNYSLQKVIDMLILQTTR